MVIFSDSFIPIVHEDCIHQISVGKRSVVEPDHILVMNVKIGNVIVHLFTSHGDQPSANISSQILSNIKASGFKSLSSNSAKSSEESSSM